MLIVTGLSIVALVGRLYTGSVPIAGIIIIAGTCIPGGTNKIVVLNAGIVIDLRKGIKIGLRNICSRSMVSKSLIY